MYKHAHISLDDVTRVTVTPIYKTGMGMVQPFYALLTIETTHCKIEIGLEAEARKNLVIVKEDKKY